MYHHGGHNRIGSLWQCCFASVRRMTAVTNLQEMDSLEEGLRQLAVEFCKLPDRGLYCSPKLFR